MSGVAYADRVLHEDRESFEMSHGWTIKEMFSKEKQQVFEEYAPATMSQDTVSYLTSLDMMSGQVCMLLVGLCVCVCVCVAFSSLVLDRMPLLLVF
jgi:hypothetical protein